MNERFTVTLEAGAGSTPAITRLRAALKCLLRSYGLRCTEAKETTTTDDARGSTETSDKVVT